MSWSGGDSSKSNTGTARAATARPAIDTSCWTCRPSILWRTSLQQLRTNNTHGNKEKTPPPICSPRDPPSADKKAQGRRPKAPRRSPPICPLFAPLSRFEARLPVGWHPCPSHRFSQKCTPGFRSSFRAKQRGPTRAKNSRFGNDKFRVRVTAGGPCPPPRPDAEAGKPAPLPAASTSAEVLLPPPAARLQRGTSPPLRNPLLSEGDERFWQVINCV